MLTIDIAHKEKKIYSIIYSIFSEKNVYIQKNLNMSLLSTVVEFSSILFFKFCCTFNISMFVFINLK